MPASFSLLGGPLHQLGRRLGLVRGDTNTVRLGLALGGGMWVVILVLALIEGVTDRMWSLSVVAGHARLLLVVPLFFACESWVAPRMTAFVQSLVRSGVVPASAVPDLDREVMRANRATAAWWPEAACLLAAVVLQITGARLQGYGATGGYDSTRTALAASAYFQAGLTLFRFLLFRWGWRFGVWCFFLWRLSRLDLRLLPGHTDRAGGLDGLQGIHERFTPLLAAISVLECASLTEDLSTGAATITAVYPWVAMVLVVDAAVFLGPLLVFTDKLWASRTKGMGAYMGLTARYVTEFEQKWVNGGPTPDEPLLGSADLQALGDMVNVTNTVRSMRWVTIGPRLLTWMAAAALAPLAEQHERREQETRRRRMDRGIDRRRARDEPFRSA